MLEPLSLLVVDDTAYLKPAMDNLLPGLESTLGREADQDFTSSYEGAEQLAAGGRTWDIAFVDLDLGTGRRSGLAVLDLLTEQPSPPKIVLFTEAYDPGRTLCLLAAYTWFDIAGVMNKIGSFTDDERMRLDFVELVVGALDDTVPPRWVPPHCKSAEVQDRFKELIPNGTWYEKFKVMRSEASSSAAAEVLKISEDQVRHDANAKVDLIPDLWRAIHASLTTANRSEANVFKEQIEAYTTDREVEPGVRRQSYSICHSFARGQELFFLDPYIAAKRQPPPASRFHQRAPQGTAPAR